MKSLLIAFIFIGSLPAFAVDGKSKLGVGSCVGQAINKLLRSEYNLDTNIKVETYVQKAYRLENFKRAEAIFPEGFVDNDTSTKRYNHDQLAYTMNIDEMINGWQRKDHYFDEHERTTFTKTNTVTPVFFDFIIKLNGTIKYNGKTNLASLKRAQDFVNDEITFYCSLKNLVIRSNKNESVLLSR